jgi:hypothetical protein
VKITATSPVGSAADMVAQDVLCAVCCGGEEGCEGDIEDVDVVGEERSRGLGGGEGGFDVIMAWRQ